MAEDDIREIARDLAVACLNHSEVAASVLAGADVKGYGMPGVLGKRVGEFYVAICKHLLEN